jgi:NTE family protein
MLEMLFSSVAEAARRPDEADAIRAKLGRMALEAETISEERWLALFAMFADTDWPAGFACTAVDAVTGRFRVWDRDAGVDVQHAVASSCAVPGIFPPVTIGATRWVDGGVRDILNADVAGGHQTVLVVSCTLLDVPPELVPPGMGDIFAATRAGLESLERDGSKVEVVIPSEEMLEVSGYGMHLMDFTRTAAAYEAGVRQGQVEAPRLSAFWTG